MDGVAVQGPVPCARRRRQRGAAWAFAAVGRGRLGGQPRCMRSEGRAVPTASSARLRARGPATGAARCERGCSGWNVVVVGVAVVVAVAVAVAIWDAVTVARRADVLPNSFTCGNSTSARA